MVPFVTPALKDLAFSRHGKLLPLTVNVRPSGPEQLVKRSELILPMWRPDSPEPLLSLPLAFDDLQDSLVPLLVSVRVVVFDLAVMGPPGLTVHLVAAKAGPALRLIVTAVATLMRKMLPLRLRIAIRPSPLIDLPEAT